MLASGAATGVRDLVADSWPRSASGGRPWTTSRLRRRDPGPGRHAHLTVDVAKGRGGGFSVEAPEGVRFLIRSRLLTDAEMDYFQLT
jgi:hypothetical protein